MKKKTAVFMVCAAISALIFTGCQASEAENQVKEDAVQKTEAEEQAAESENNPEQGSTEAEGSYKIGIAQFAQHASLDNCRKGFLEGLAEEGIAEGKNLTIEYQNAEADTGIANQIAQNFTAGKVDLICAIATPTAQSAYNAALKTEIPVIYTAVNDPVGAQLAKADGTPAGNTTGTSDKLPVEKQLAMIREILPDAKKIGIIYTSSEVNSETAVEEYQALSAQYGFEFETVAIHTIADVPLAADSILGKVDCLTNLTDNTVVSALTTILDKANAKKIPVFGSEVEQVKIGCLAAEGLDYVELGKETGKMAAKVLKGEVKASGFPFKTIEDSSLYLNTEAAKKLGIQIEKEISDRAAEIFTKIAVE